MRIKQSNSIKAVVDLRSNVKFRMLDELIQYRDLIFILVKRDLMSLYKQTFLGPIWFFLQPLLAALMYYFVLNKIAGFHPGNTYVFLFYLSGLTVWTFFSDNFNKVSDTFSANAGLFGKVYFPRLVMPSAVFLSNLLKFSIQFIFFLSVWIYYLVTDKNIQPNYQILLFLPFVIIATGIMGMSLGLIFSTITLRYRDLRFVIGFGLQLLMLISPVLYSSSLISGKMRTVFMLNPLAVFIEAFRSLFLGTATFQLDIFLYAILFTLAILIISLRLFLKAEKNFIDIV